MVCANLFVAMAIVAGYSRRLRSGCSFTGYLQRSAAGNLVENWFMCRCSYWMCRRSTVPYHGLTMAKIARCSHYRLPTHTYMHQWIHFICLFLCAASEMKSCIHVYVQKYLYAYFLPVLPRVSPICHGVHRCIHVCDGCILYIYLEVHFSL